MKATLLDWLGSHVHPCTSQWDQGDRMIDCTDLSHAATSGDRVEVSSYYRIIRTKISGDTVFWRKIKLLLQKKRKWILDKEKWQMIITPHKFLFLNTFLWVFKNYLLPKLLSTVLEYFNKLQTWVLHCYWKTNTQAKTKIPTRKE